MKVVALLLVVLPAVVFGHGGEFRKMWDEMESKEGGSSHGGDSNSDEMMGGWSMEMGGDSHGDKGEQNELFAAFKDWIHEQKEEKHDDKEDFKEYMKQHAMNYRKYKDLKEMKEMQEKQEKMEMMRMMMKMKMKKHMVEQMRSTEEEFMHKRLQYVFGISTSFLDFCQCDDGKDALMRLHDGRYGMENGINNNGMNNGMGNNMTMPGMNSTMNNSSQMAFTYNGTVYNMTDPMAMQHFAAWFSQADQQEQVKCVLDDLVRVMCGTARHYLAEFSKFEESLMAFRRSNP